MGVRSYPDYGVTPSAYIPADVDMAELAARVSAVDRYRREGKVLSLADCAPDLDGWNLQTLAYLSTTKAIIGNTSVLLSGPYGSTPLISKYFPVTANLKMGLSFYVNVDFYTDNYLFIQLQALAPPNWRYARIRVDFSTGTITHLNNSGIYTTIHMETNLIQVNRWHNLKLIADFENDLYLRFFLNNTDLFAGNTAPLYTSGASGPGMGFLAQIYAQSVNPAHQTNINIDGMILSIHEF